MNSLNIPWLPKGMEYLVGAGENRTLRTPLMVMQVYVDESARGDKDAPHFVMVGVVSHIERWLPFYEQWKECLESEPVPIQNFKYAKFIKNLDGNKRRKLKELASIISKHASMIAPIVIDFPYHKEKIGVLNEKSTKHPYFLAATCILEKVASALWDQGEREQIEFVFDRQDIWCKRFSYHYEAFIDMHEEKKTYYRSILPIDPVQRNDDKVLPLQAADFLAGLYRQRADSFPNMPQDWLLEEFSSVPLAPGPHYLDKELIDQICEPLDEEIHKAHARMDIRADEMLKTRSLD